jgi:hypothetical protein
VRDAALAEQAGFDFAVISDHYFPWLQAKSGKNRLHLDLRTIDLAGEAERVLALGAKHSPATP